MTLSTSETNIWEKIEESDDNRLVLRLVDPDSRWWFYWAKNSDFPAAMYIDFNLDLNFSDRSIKGIIVEAKPISSGKTGILIAMTGSRDLEIFETFCRRLVLVANGYTDEEAVVGALRNEIADWHEFLGRKRRGLSFNTRLGLYAELQILMRLQSDVGPIAALNLWTGPSHSSQDFLSDGMALEVKAVIMPGTTIKVSSEFQLDYRQHSFLGLVVVGVIEVEGGENLSTIINELVEIFDQSDPMAKYEFLRKLSLVGVDDISEYSFDSWKVFEYSTYNVISGFPSVSRSDIPKQISSVKYSLNLEGVEEFKVSNDSLFQNFLRGEDE